MFLFRIMYLLGLGFLLNYLLLESAVSQLETVIGPSPHLLMISIILIMISFIGEWWNYGSLANAMKVTGLITIIPGIIGVLIIAKDNALFFQSAQELHILKASVTQTLISAYVDTQIPNSGIILSAYILIGIILCLFGHGMKS